MTAAGHHHIITGGALHVHHYHHVPDHVPHLYVVPVPGLLPQQQDGYEGGHTAKEEIDTATPTKIVSILHHHTAPTPVAIATWDGVVGQLKAIATQKSIPTITTTTSTITITHHYSSLIPKKTTTSIVTTNTTTTTNSDME